MARNVASDASSAPKRGRGSGKPFAPGNKAGTHRGGSRPAALLRMDAQAEGEAREVLRAVMDAAKGGDMSAAALILARIWPARRGRPAILDAPLPEGGAAAMTAILDAATTGQLTAEEAAALSIIVGRRAELIEVADLAARLRRLEQSRGEEP